MIGGDARQAERELFAVCRALYAGRLPAVPTDPARARRLGYLAEVTALLLAAPDRVPLLDLAEGCRRASRPEPPLHLSTLTPAPAPSRNDDLAREWGFAEGLDIARLKSEWHALGRAAVR